MQGVKLIWCKIRVPLAMVDQVQFGFVEGGSFPVSYEYCLSGCTRPVSLDVECGVWRGSLRLSAT